MQQRITMPEIFKQEWLKNLPADLMDEKTMNNQYEKPNQPMQSIDTIMQIISEATILPIGLYNFDMMDDDMEDLDSDDPNLDIDNSGEVIYVVWLHFLIGVAENESPQVQQNFLIIWVCNIS